MAITEVVHEVRITVVQVMFLIKSVLKTGTCSLRHQVSAFVSFLYLDLRTDNLIPHGQ
jgi:hypothetical protein